METFTVKISTKSKKGKHLIGLIEELAKTDVGIQILNSPVPNKITLKAMEDAENGKAIIAQNVDDLFNSI